MPSTACHRRLVELGGLFAASESVTPDEFETFVSVAFSGQVGIDDVRWAPRVRSQAEATSGERAAFGQSDPGGVRIYPFPGSTGPDDGIATSLAGVDMPALLAAAVAGHSRIAQLLGHRETGSAAAEPRYAILVAAPAYSGPLDEDSAERRKARITGLAMGRADLAALVAHAARRHGVDYRLQIADVAGDAPRTVFGSPSGTGLPGVSHRLAIEGMDLVFTYTATPAFMATRQDWVSWSLLVVGLAFVTLLNALTLLSTARTDLVQRLVDEKTAEAEALSRNLSLVLANAADAIIALDGNGRATTVNPAAARLLGYTPDDLLGRVIHDLIHPVDSDGVAHTLGECHLVAEGRRSPLRDLIEPFRRKDGSSFTAEYSSEPILDDNGDFIGVVAVFRDITEREQAQAERERFISELSRANGELERFAFAASHDLQEPLRLISNFNALLARRYGDRLDEAGHSYIQHSIQAAGRMQALISDLLAYGQLDHDNEPRATDLALGEVVNDALHNLGSAIESAGAEIEVGELPTVPGNRAQLTQLMQNLIGNAIKYHSAGTRPRVRVYAEPGDGAWRIGVADNGIGVAAPYRQQIFQPFQRLHAKDAYPGTGMGLAICRKIVESHGGVLWMEDSSAGGSLFLFTLPRTAVQPDDAD